MNAQATMRPIQCMLYCSVWPYNTRPVNPIKVGTYAPHRRFSSTYVPACARMYRACSHMLNQSPHRPPRIAPIIGATQLVAKAEGLKEYGGGNTSCEMVVLTPITQATKTITYITVIKKICGFSWIRKRSCTTLKGLGRPSAFHPVMPSSDFKCPAGPFGLFWGLSRSYNVSSPKTTISRTANPWRPANTP